MGWLAVVCASQGKGLYGACGALLAERADEGAHSGTGGKDVVDEEERSEGREVMN